MATNGATILTPKQKKKAKEAAKKEALKQAQAAQNNANSPASPSATAGAFIVTPTPTVTSTPSSAPKAKVDLKKYETLEVEPKDAADEEIRKKAEAQAEEALEALKAEAIRYSRDELKETRDLDSGLLVTDLTEEKELADAAVLIRQAIIGKAQSEKAKPGKVDPKKGFPGKAVDTKGDTDTLLGKLIIGAKEGAEEQDRDILKREMIFLFLSLEKLRWAAKTCEDKNNQKLFSGNPILKHTYQKLKDFLTKTLMAGEKTGIKLKLLMNSFGGSVEEVEARAKIGKIESDLAKVRRLQTQSLSYVNVAEADVAKITAHGVDAKQYAEEAKRQYETAKSLVKELQGFIAKMDIELKGAKEGLQTPPNYTKVDVHAKQAVVLKGSMYEMINQINGACSIVKEQLTLATADKATKAQLEAKKAQEAKSAQEAKDRAEAKQKADEAADVDIKFIEEAVQKADQQAKDVKNLADGAEQAKKTAVANYTVQGAKNKNLGIVVTQADNLSTHAGTVSSNVNALKEILARARAAKESENYPEVVVQKGKVSGIVAAIEKALKDAEAAKNEMNSKIAHIKDKKDQADKKAQAEAEAKQKAEADAKAKAQAAAEAKAKAETDAKLKAEEQKAATLVQDIKTACVKANNQSAQTKEWADDAATAAADARRDFGKDADAEVKLVEEKANLVSTQSAEIKKRLDELNGVLSAANAAKTAGNHNDVTIQHGKVKGIVDAIEKALKAAEDAKKAMGPLIVQAKTKKIAADLKNAADAKAAAAQAKADAAAKQKVAQASNGKILKFKAEIGTAKSTIQQILNKAMSIDGQVQQAVAKTTLATTEVALMQTKLKVTQGIPGKITKVTRELEDILAKANDAYAKGDFAAVDVAINGAKPLFAEITQINNDMDLTVIEVNQLIAKATTIHDAEVKKNKDMEDNAKKNLKILDTASAKAQTAINEAKILADKAHEFANKAKQSFGSVTPKEVAEVDTQAKEADKQLANLRTAALELKKLYEVSSAPKNPSVALPAHYAMIEKSALQVPALEKAYLHAMDAVREARKLAEAHFNAASATAAAKAKASANANTAPAAQKTANNTPAVQKTTTPAQPGLSKPAVPKPSAAPTTPVPQTPASNNPTPPNIVMATATAIPAGNVGNVQPAAVPSSVPGTILPANPPQPPILHAAALRDAASAEYRAMLSQKAQSKASDSSAPRKPEGKK